jgi:phosphatidylglycerophosphate synthase
MRALVIDARPRGPRGLLAAESVLGRPVLMHLVEAARGCGDADVIAVHARDDEHSPLRGLIADSSAIIFRTGPPPEGAAILRTDRLYDGARLRRAVRSGRDPEVAVIWRLDRPGALASADAELTRRRSYQPLGRYWALAPAKRLANALAPTSVRPNEVTMAAAIGMLSAAGIVATGRLGLGWRIGAAAMLALALVLDTADGHLARLQGTASEFGRWLDSVLDELSDMALHAAIAWGAYARSGHVAWLALGMLYGMGKYVFLIAQEPVANAPGGVVEPPASPGIIKRLVRLIGHADVRWHLWIVLAALGRLEWALVAYAAYFPVRTAMMAARKAVRHAR